MDALFPEDVGKQFGKQDADPPPKRKVVGDSNGP